MIIYTDYLAGVNISKQTTLKTASTNKLNLRLVRALQYLLTFNLELRYKAGKTNLVPDTLLRLDIKNPQPLDQEEEGILDVLYGNTEANEEEKQVLLYGVNIVIPIYYATLVEIADNFK